MKKKSENNSKIICPASGEEFIPKRENQIYKNMAVQIKHNNDRAKLKRSQLKKFNDNINGNEKKLMRLHNYMLQCNWNSIPIEYFDYEGINFETFTSSVVNNKTNKTVFWCLSYGFEPVDEKMKLFYIYKNTKS